MRPGRSILPVSSRVPLLAAVLVFLFVTATNQVALRLTGLRMDQEAERLGRVYLDGVSAAVLPALRQGDSAALREALQRAMGFQEGIRERRMVVTTPGGETVVEAGIGPDPEWLAPVHRGHAGAAWEISADGDAVWAQRPLSDAGAVIAILAAKLDVSSIAEQRHRLRVAMLVFGFALALLGGALAAYAARQALRPVLGVTAALGRAGAGPIAPIPPAAMPPPGTEAARLAEAFNGMVARVAEREALARSLADRERAATLGRLVAAVAHEVRNPLAGMLTAVESAREFGEDPAERGEALEVIERGLLQIERVVSSMLAMYRDGGPPRPLEAADLDDLRVLVTPQAGRRGVRLDWSVRLQAAFPTDASLLRQAVLNLLLNAVAATPRGGRVGLEVRCAARGAADGTASLLVTVEDEGPGMPPDARHILLGGTGRGDLPGLGLEVVAALARRLGAGIAVQPGPGGRGTRVTLAVPAAEGAAAPQEAVPA